MDPLIAVQDHKACNSQSNIINNKVIINILLLFCVFFSFKILVMLFKYLVLIVIINHYKYMYNNKLYLPQMVLLLSKHLQIYFYLCKRNL